MKQKKPKRRGLYAVSFVVSFAVLALISGFLFWQVNFHKDAQQAGEPQKNIPIYQPNEEDEMALLTAIVKKETGQPDLFYLIRFTPAKQRIRIAALPAELIAFSMEKTDTLSDFYLKEGIMRTANVVSSLAGCEIDKYLVLGDQAAISLIDLTDGVAINQPYEIKYDLDGLKITVPQGNIRLDGDGMYYLLQYRDFAEGPAYRYQLAAECLAGWMNQQLPALSQEQRKNIFEAAVNASDTNLNAADFESRQRALDHVALAQNPAESFAVSGSLDYKQRFVLSDESKMALYQFFR